MSCKDCSEIKNNPTSKKTATTKDESRWSWFGILPLLFLGVTEEQQLGRETPQKVGVFHLNLKHLHLSKQALHKLLIRKISVPLASSHCLAHSRHVFNPE